MATGVIPLAVQALLNSKIYLSIRQSKQQLRILAIRSALPMAILSKAAPSVAMSDLLGQTNNNNNGHTPATAETTPAAAGTSPGVGGEVIAEAQSPASAAAPNGESGENNVVVITKAEVPSPKNGRIVNGRIRQMQRSVSAFVEPSSPSIRRALRLKNSPDMFRSNSDAVSTEVSMANNANGSVETGTRVNRVTAAVASDTNCSDPTPPVPTTRANSSTWNNNNNNNNINNGNGNPAPTTGVTPAGADMRLAPILFGVVIVFVLCNSLRVILNIYDFSVVDGIIKCERKGVGRVPPSWILCSISVSHLLLMVNSSVNFLVYCVAGTKFRRVLMTKIRGGFDRLMGRNGNNTQTEQQQQQQQLQLQLQQRQRHLYGVRRRHTTMLTTDGTVDEEAAEDDDDDDGDNEDVKRPLNPAVAAIRRNATEL